MGVQRIFTCDAEGCEHHVKTRFDSPPCFLTVREGGDGSRLSTELHFCSWDCCMKYAAKFEPPEVIEFGRSA